VRRSHSGAAVPRPIALAAAIASADAGRGSWPQRSAATGTLAPVRQQERRGQGKTTQEVVWELHLASLRAYKNTHGDCNVPTRWAEEPGLGAWVSMQRKRKKALDRGEPSEGMTAAWAAKLDALGFVWEGSARRTRDETGWQAQLANLQNYKRRHGDCDVPQRWAEDLPLGRWVMTQRAGKRRLDRGEPSDGMTVTRAAKLDALGIAWEGSNTDEARWEGWLAKVTTYKNMHGDCNVPNHWAEDRALGSWVSMQRKGKKALDRGARNAGMTAARAAKLDALGFAWEGSAGGARNETGWEAQLAKLQNYKRHHGDCDVPQRWAEDLPLGRWVMTQRAGKKRLDRGEPSDGMTVTRAAKLEALGFAWCPLDIAHDAALTMAEMDTELRRLKLPTTGSKERGRKLRLARGAERPPGPAIPTRLAPNLHAISCKPANRSY
jgi:hypothetical protein